MSIITEASLRNELKDKEISQYIVNSGIIVTPSAKEYLRERKIELVMKDQKEDSLNTDHEHEGKESIQPKYSALFDGGYFDDKPEYMTHIFGSKLVLKDHPRIIFRGKLDSLQSKILEVQVAASKQNKKDLVNDLNEVLTLCRNTMRAEVLNEPLADINILGLDEKKLREMSHEPKKYFNIQHILPSWEMGEMLISLNTIRSTVREVEIAAVKAFKSEDGISRTDIIRAMNRLSSCIYIMMLRQASGHYR